MKVVLRESIRGLGHTGDIVNVRDGYARNFLLPQGKAEAPSADRIRFLQKERLRYLDQESDKIAAAKTLAASLGDLAVEVAMKANDAGQLFGSVTEAIVAEKLSESLSREVRRDQVILGSHFKRIGDYAGVLRLHPEVEIEIALHVVAEETEEEREERLAAEAEAREALERAEAEADAEEGLVDEEEERSD